VDHCCELYRGDEALEFWGGGSGEERRGEERRGEERRGVQVTSDGVLVNWGCCEGAIGMAG